MPRALRYRAPNPPAAFAGRSQELAWIRRRFDDGPLVVVAGPTGIGKTALVLRALRDLDAADDVLFVAARPDDPLESVLRHLLWALCEYTGRDADVVSEAQDPEIAVGVALGLAEEAAAIVVLDDLQHIGNDDEATEILVQVASYARHSRWLVTSRELPKDRELAGRGFVLGALDESQLTELGRDLAPSISREHVRLAATRAGGSPWMFLQLLQTPSAEPARLGAELLHGLSPAADELLRSLCAARLAFPRKVLLRLHSSGDEPLRALLERGLVVASPEGYRAHDAVRAWVTPEPGRALGVARFLSGSDSPMGWVDALRIYLEAGRVAPALSILEQNGQALLAGGEAPRLWQVIGRRREADLRVWQMRCASELGNATVLAAVGPLRPDRPESRAAWARLQLLMGEPGPALETLGEPADLSADERDLASRCLLQLGRLDEIELLVDEGSLVDRARAMRGVQAAGASGVDLDTLSARERIDAAWAAWWRRDSGAAARILRDALGPERGRLDLLLARESALLTTRLSLDEGALVESRRQLDELAPFMRGPTLLRPLFEALRAELRVVSGERLDTISAAYHPEGDEAASAWLSLFLQIGLALGRGGPCEIAGTQPGWRFDLYVELEKCRRRLLTDPRRALERARQLRREASDLGLVTIVCESLALEIDAATLAEIASSELSAHLLELATSIDSLRFAAFAQYSARSEDPALVERIAASASTSPRAARRARAQLVASTPLDPVDREVVRRRSSAWPTPPRTLVELTESDAWAPAWGIRTGDQSVWRADGTSHDLSRRPKLFRLLARLFESDGRASKEELIVDVWEEATYHPLKHDPKLFVAIRTLRKIIEPDDRVPRHLMTSDDGYFLARPVRRLD